MRTTLTTALAAAAAIPLAFLTAAPATAAPGDISAVFTTTPNPGGSNTVTGTFTATGSSLPRYCAMTDYSNNDAGLFAGMDAEPSSPLVVTDTDVADGTYTIEWLCYLAPGEGDGTMRALGLANYSAPSILVVPAVTPEEPEPGCTGSVCLPTGSFGF
ncbi:MAG: hypothetical protein U5O16_21720 [Rhodococcus sp. (in: high G+C Gram-positive bacteria)]|uniref:Uncharacterized protein n=1 Tax=Rhodococcus navarretei TaxID=3128981 RepID=A0ABU9D164_9NOCA|nr:hypothetical protein [Rhodococcus sp. (in: high G+C Gram-positive bacteria)]